MKLSELSPAEGSVRSAFRKGRGAGCGNGKKPAAAATRARRPAAAARSALALRAARCLWPAASPSAASTTFSPKPLEIINPQRPERL